MNYWRIATIGLLGVLLGSCGEDGEVYQRPVTEVRDLLRTVEVPLYMFGNSTDTQARMDASDPTKIMWKITSDGISLMTFTANVIPEGDTKTRVIVDVEGSRTGKYGDIQARLDKAKEIRTLYLVSMTEAVDSTLDGRAYDITATYSALMSATTANLGRMFPPTSNAVGPS